ncbi:formate dehydrogenase subunit alpha [Yersinia mollaretii]|uniref:Formate dehydrogenase H n=1 Tax=Yersinia mollaretii (strain ATCC 43969 / DSM 18520 / CIP 103324 / CNY 7263 / WAIP 204) TaxID=349967 RepID=A0ABP2EAQ0_YERMW|nr:formate dehydrogenase subunit alpha [Yersinia mollaretii]EEQ09513.1 Formate dehydrogenase H [Yersinia mollaretii ATCC 43969]MDN0110576.1 formate dehydrogenase subunit alpha [Yersinia mollaretii]PJE86924.1 formate dehydrogenase subunit alpha [Yersinia mollaretii]QKJ03793.1 formate dehydrogenase subunit alpha [Yersinia mollaretii ATCC 43969]CQD38715.1 formate dehydrogenase H [Yersinia mollaretii]
MYKALTVCPYCGSGCKINLLVENGKVVGAEGANGVTNQGELCLKGYYGWDFLNDTKLLTPRLKQPMIRRQKGGKLEAVSWDEAIEFASSKLRAIKEKYGPEAIMHTGSSRGPGNETNYVMQKFARAVTGSNNIDCCARVCHGPSVAGLQVTLGNGAMSNSICEIEDTKCILVFGYNAADSHPIVARRILKAKEKGAKVIVCDPRHIETARIADLWLPLKNGSNMALVNAFANVLITEELYDKDYVSRYTEGFDEYREIVAKYTPEYVESITGLPAQTIREAMRIYAAAPSATILWGMGVTQWGQGVDVVKGLSGLALLTGNLGRPNVGVGPVRGQNNVQGACDMGALPNMYPGYQPVTDPATLAKFAKAWGVPSLSDKIGYSLTDVPHKVKEGKIKANYVMGEDPLQTEPDLSMMREAFSELELLIVQDIFMTKTAAEADVIFPATSWGEHEGVYSAADRGFQRFEKAVDAQGDVKPDWEIISLMATALGYPMKYHNTKEIWDELRELCPLYYGATYEKMAGLGYIPWPCTTEDSPGTPWLYAGNKFDRPGGKGLLFASEWRAPMELVDDAYPLVLCTVREVGHYSCRSMTGNCSALQTLADEPGYVQISPQDADKMQLRDQQLVWVESRRGKVITRVSVSERINVGAVYMTYQWWIGACNELTLDHLDPISKTPEYKYCAVKLEAIPDQGWAENYVQQEYSQLKARLRREVEA